MKKRTLIVLLVFLLILICGIAAFTVYYINGMNELQGKFLYNTYINNIDVSLLTPEEANEKIFKDYYPGENITITFEDSEFTLTSADFDYSVENGAYDFLDYIDYSKWITSKMYPTKFNYEMQNDVASAATDYVMANWDIFDEDTWVYPVDAYIDYSEDDGYYIVPDVRGNVIDLERARAAIYKMITEKDADKDLASYYNILIADRTEATDETLVSLKDTLNEMKNPYIEYGFTLEDIQSLSNYRAREEFEEHVVKLMTALNKLTGLEITYNYAGMESKFTGENIIDYLSVDWNTWLYDFNKDDCVTDFMRTMAAKYNTMGATRNFITHDGATVQISGGDWGWWLNQNDSADLLAQYIDNRESIDGELVWLQEGGTASANNDSSCDFTNYVEIDLTNQHVYMYRNGELIVDSDCVSGCEAEGNMTPAGIYSLTYKDRNATLSGADYSVEVSYWMPFNGGIGLHDATWKSSFGGTVYKYNGTHGCVGLPLDKARQIYENLDSSYAMVCYWR